MCLIFKTTASAVRLSGLVRFTHSADLFFLIISCYLIGTDTKYFVVVVVINLESVINAKPLALITDEKLTHRPFSIKHTIKVR